MPPSCADMTGRRLLYLTVLLIGTVFDIAYGQWLSGLLLTTILALPWFSLLLSLPAIFRFRGGPSGPDTLGPGQPGELWLMGTCACPMPPFRGKLKLRNRITGQTWFYQEPGDLQADHCGGITVTAESFRVCDYLGLFAFPVRCREEKTILIRPRPLKLEPGEDLQRIITGRWQPRSGGGYSETHDLRPYRPGDGLNQIHWKLSAKTGGLIIREPMEPQNGTVLLTLNHRGTGAELDRKLGRLLWLGGHLLDQGIRFELRALTGEGILTFSVNSDEILARAVDALLCSRAAEDGDLRSRDFSASWHCHIGGEPDAS